jgi:hypothetical protein
MADVDSKLLHELFEYRDGVLFWKSTRSTRKDIIGKKVGSPNSGGYLITKINGQQFLVHRIIYQMFNGEMPNTLDHIDGNRINNKIENLRPATLLQNAYNKKNYLNNKTGIKGVSFNRQCGKYFARCQVNKKQNWLGFFETSEQAENAVQKFRKQHHGEFANHG